MTTDTLSHIHRLVPGTDPNRRPVLLLHGTGGDETDLLPLGRAVAPGAALLSPRGAVLEHGRPRFFRRLAEGIFDETDVRRRAHDLADFVLAARERYRLDTPLALGFSNGANVAAAVLHLRPEALAGAVLLRAMVPLTEPPVARLDGLPVLLLSGSADPIVPAENAARLSARLAGAGATLEHHVLPAGHGLTQADLDLTTAWLARH
ncbi:alpha/beta hydrolase [Rhodobacter sp. CZR27]|uniref:alpha/beta hydrolase n=1 Tax=Rhodobacter sp. CZR27 TaxID=2033869 RepID=UPI000BBEC200|nr:alpha/beta hydrolase [Rhodobacter sp. CZR27]